MIDCDAERRRLSATLLNTVASGVITAGTAGSFIAFSLAAQPGALATRVALLWVLALIAGAALHLLARALIKRSQE